MRLIRFDSMHDIHSKLAKASEAHLPADEQRAVRRVSFTERSHVETGIKGGQGRSGADLEKGAVAFSMPVLLALAALLGIALAELMARGATVFGAVYLSN